MQTYWRQTNYIENKVQPYVPFDSKQNMQIANFLLDNANVEISNSLFPLSQRQRQQLLLHQTMRGKWWWEVEASVCLNEVEANGDEKDQNGRVLNEQGVYNLELNRSKLEYFTTLDSAL